MRLTLTDANFPRTADGRVYHLGIRAGEVANRIITVGSRSRAEAIAKNLDASPQHFVLNSERGFTTITGRYKGVPISIVSIGMGYPNMDFFVREVRECISGDMLVIRLGSCGALVDVPVGSVVLPSSSVAITRNYDFDFVNPGYSSLGDAPYRISKPAPADQTLHEELRKAIESARPTNSTNQILSGTVNASADSFYGSQGRVTSFPDHNASLIEQLRQKEWNVSTLEMETFHLYHLALSWAGVAVETDKPASSDIPLAAGPVKPELVSEPHPAADQNPIVLAGKDTVIRAAAVHLVFASRTSQAFITPDEVTTLEGWAGLGVLNALANISISEDRLHPQAGSVWEVKEA